MFIVAESKTVYCETFNLLALFGLLTKQENLILLYTSNKGADLPVHPCSLVSIFVIHFLESITNPLATYKISKFYCPASQE